MMFAELEMIVIPAGGFVMGYDAGAENERPAHRVFIDEFAIGRFAITNQLYRLFIQDSGHQLPPAWSDSRFNHPDQPVSSVSWFDATAYCEWLSDRTGKPYRLPTEAEWERAARGGLEGKLYTWGDEPPSQQPNYSELWLSGPERVGQRAPNAFGLYDISENVHEWCSDWYDERYYLNSPARNPRGPVTGARRASRGGSWRHQIKITRVAARSSIPPEFKYSDYGFRCALGGLDLSIAMTVEGFEPSKRIGKRAFEGMQEAKAEIWATDCPLGAIQFQQHAGVKPMYPMTILARAYRDGGFEKPPWTKRTDKRTSKGKRSETSRTQRSARLCYIRRAARRFQRKDVRGEGSASRAHRRISDSSV